MIASIRLKVPKQMMLYCLLEFRGVVAILHF